MRWTEAGPPTSSGGEAAARLKPRQKASKTQKANNTSSTSTVEVVGHEVVEVAAHEARTTTITRGEPTTDTTSTGQAKGRHISHRNMALVKRVRPLRNPQGQ